MSGIVVAVTDSMVAGKGRQPIVIRRGEAWDASDPVVLAHPDLALAFGPGSRAEVPRGYEIDSDSPW